MFFMKHISLLFGWLGLTVVLHEAQAWTYHYQTREEMDWETARQWCQKYYTDMVAIQNQAEIAYLNNTLPFHNTYYWIGIRKQEGEWKWVGTQKPLTDEAANWATGEPNNIDSGQDCVEIYIKRAIDTAMWNDEKCNKKKAALCYQASCVAASCEHAECVEIIGNYTCQCRKGYTGSRCEQVVSCENLTILNGKTACSDPQGQFLFHSSCSVICEKGYTLRGEDNLTCLETGNWSAETPTCQAEEMSIGTSLLLYIAVGAGSSVCLLLVAGLIVLVVCRLKKKKKKKKKKAKRNVHLTE